VTSAIGRKVTPTGVLVAPYNVPADEWHALRQAGIGGSDVAALLGMDRYKSPFGLWLEKRGEMPDRPVPEKLARAAYWGHKHERDMSERFCELTGMRTRRIGLIRHETDEWRRANLDYRVLGCPDGPCGLELKNRSYYKAREWGETGDPDGVPDKEALQTVHYLAVTGFSHFHVGVLLEGNDDRWYRIDRDEQLIDDVVAMERSFMERVWSGEAPPLDGHAALTELMAVLYAGDEDARKELDPVKVESLLSRRAMLKAQIAQAAEEVDGCENQLKELLGEAEVAVGPDGERLYTRKQNGQFSEKRFRETYPELVEKYETTVPALDVDAIKADHPDKHRACRARVLRIPKERG